MSDTASQETNASGRAALIRVLKWGFMVVAVALLVWALAARWDEVSQALEQVGWRPVAIATLFAMLALAFNTLSWRAVMRSLGLDAPLGQTATVFLVSQAGKYVPGAVWPVLAQAEFAREYGVTRVRAFTGSLVAMLVGVSTAGVVGAVGLLMAAPSGGTNYWWAVAIALMLFAALTPPGVRFVAGLALKLMRRSAEPVNISGGALAQSVVWSVLNWVALGVHAWILLGPLTADADGALLLAMGAFALSWLVGFLVLVAPAGIGAREATLVALLASVATAPQALAVAVLSRFAMTVADAAGLAVGGLIRAFRKRATS